MLFGKHINRYYLKYAPVLLLGIFALILVDVAQLWVPSLYRMVIDGINNGSVIVDGTPVPFDMNFLLDRVCLPFLFIILALLVGRFLWRICFFGSAIRVETDIRRRMFDRCKLLSQQYYQANKVGSLMSLFTNDLETVQDCFGSGILMFFDALCLGVLAIFNMFRMDPLLTLLSMIPMAILLVCSTLLEKAFSARWEKRQAAFSRLSDFSQESFAGIAVIKAFVKEAKELHAFRKLNLESEKANVNFTKLAVTFDICVTLFVESVICIILGYGGFLVYKGSFSAGQLIEFVSYFTAVVWPILAISQLVQMRSEGKASLNRIAGLLEAEIHVKDRPDVTDPGMLQGNIEFRHLTFRYPGAEYDALSDVSFSIRAGENVGIIGKTGSGKTTLVDLILRTYNVPDGTLFLDGRDVNTIPISAVRRSTAYVPQDNFLFSDTIENNISFATDGGRHTDVERAARLSDVDANIKGFSEGYETVLGERGVTVSGGQKQRISIARALMKNAPILILDDSVSAVDVKTEKIILENLARERSGKTTLLIAHRISTVKQMDKILFVEDGRVCAVGTHETLYNTCPEYRIMVDLQQLDEAPHTEPAPHSEPVSHTEPTSSQTSADALPSAPEGKEVDVHA